MPGLPFGWKNPTVFDKVPEVLRKVFHWLGGCIRADVPGRAVSTHRPAVIVRTLKSLPKFSVDHLILMVVSQGMRPFMSE